jgi:dCMP deaminase
MPKRSPANKVLVAYVPVLHRGYIEFFNSYPAHKQIYVVGEELLASVDYLRKDLRALSPEVAVEVLKTFDQFEKVGILNQKDIETIDKVNFEVVLPNEDISREVGKKFKKAKLSYHPIFLRWDRQSIEAAEVDPEEKVTSDKKAQRYMSEAVRAADSSSDIWRRVGAVLVSKNGKMLGRASNEGEPTAHSPWMEGDPRNIFHRGVGIEMSLFIHAEAFLIAEAAKTGTSLQDASIYVTTFPCPACSKLIAHSGIENLYYKDGYAVLDGKKVLESYGVNVKRVALDDSSGTRGSEFVPYKQI